MKRFFADWVLAGLAFAAAGAFAAEPGFVTNEFIYLTAPFPQCHASTLAESKGRLVAAWFGGLHEKSPDVGIWVSRRENGLWTPPMEAANGILEPGKRVPCWNPVLFQAPAGPLLLFYKAGPAPDAWWGMLMTSADGGVTWSKPRRLPDGVIGPVKNKPVLLPSGELLCPTSTEHNGWRVHFERTSDWGATWQSTPAVNDGLAIRAIQPSILFHPGGRLQAIGRTSQGRLFQTWSSDAGRSWSPMTLTALPNPNAGTDAVTLRDGRHLLVYNHTTKGRTPLNMAVSDDGKEWRAALALETSPGEYSYPAVIQTADGLVHVSYTWKRTRIRHAVIDPAALELRPLPSTTP